MDVKLVENVKGNPLLELAFFPLRLSFVLLSLC